MATELLQNLIRRVPDSALAALRMVPDLACRPALFAERNGRGDGYHTLRYRVPSPHDGRMRPRSVYVGALTPEEARLVRAWITLCRARPFGCQAEADKAMTRLRSRRREALSVASGIAEKRGLYFVGYALRRRRRLGTPAAAGRPESGQAYGGCEVLRSSVSGVLKANEDILSVLTDALMDQLRRQAILLGCGAKRHVSTPVLRLIGSLRHTFRISQTLIRAGELLKAQAGAGEAA